MLWEDSNSKSLSFETRNPVRISRRSGDGAKGTRLKSLINRATSGTGSDEMVKENAP